MVELNYLELDKEHPKPIRSGSTNIPDFNNTAGAIATTVVIVLFTSWLIFPIFLSPLIYLFMKRTISKSGDSSVKLSNFAVTNGFSYRWNKQKNSPKNNVRLPGVIGKDKTVNASNVIAGKVKDLKFTYFNPYTKGFYTVLKVNLKNHYPHILLDSKGNNPFISNVSFFFDANKNMDLEGDFNNYFSLYSKAPPTDTLRILSPDVMGDIIDFGSKVDVELYEDSLILISNFKYSNSENASYMFNLADKILDNLDRRSATRTAEFDSDSKLF